MRIINLSSGSDGNLTYIESENARILVDDGLSCKETEKRLALLGVRGQDIDAIVISHEHIDHIKGVDVFSSKFDTPVFAHDEVWGQGLDGKLSKVSSKNRKIFDGTFELKDLVINPVEVPHDVKCFGYCISEGEKKVSILTDLGHTSEAILKGVQGSTLVYVEANHDLEMLKNNPHYPISTRMRIAGNRGHLSNDASARFISHLVTSGTRQIMLSHLSTENNSPELAYTYITNLLAQHGFIEGEGFKIDVATTQPSTLFRLKN